MKSKILFTLFLSLFLSYHLAYAQSVTAAATGCSSIQANLANITQNLYIASATWDCSQTSVPVYRTIAGATVPGARYILEKLNGSTFQEVQGSGFTNSEVWNFTGLSMGTYRVQARRMLNSGVSVYESTNPCGPPIGILHDGAVTVSYSPTIELGTPSSSFNFWDNSGTIGNDVFCTGDPVTIDGSDSFGETQYTISICLLDVNGQCSAYNSSGWTSGKVGVVDLLNIWRIGHPTWNFWAGNTYRVTLALSSPCNGWVAQSEFFSVVNSGCRLGTTTTDNAITIFPNPASNFIKLDGFDDENIPDEIDFQIFNAGGKLMQQNKLFSIGQSIDVSELIRGMYVLRLFLEDEVVTKKFVVN